ncbi:WD40 repeat domain-containing protein [Candidatus Chlorohelix sp.]|uniref:WD40 repeat domain-containing protein n=1 Tax=Candidatus Chlorohelix sp. TaxID=3139201 RepID=UPI003049A449
MPSVTRPRLDEFLLAVLWLITVPVWAYFGFVGYFINLFTPLSFRLPGFVIGFFFLCLLVFGLRFALKIFLRLPKTPPKWLDSSAPVVMGTTLLLGSLFSLFTLVVMIYYLFSTSLEDLMFVWGFITAIGVLVFGIYLLLAAIYNFEPFLMLFDKPNRQKIPWFLNWAIWLNQFRIKMISGDLSRGQSERLLHGPLAFESDLHAIIHDEKVGVHPALEKTMIGQGGWHVNTLGITANASVIFAASDGSVPHFQAGGRKGVLFPPEIKFWDWHTNKIQTTTLAKTQSFITRNKQVPESLLNYTFLVPAGGGKFVWVIPNTVYLGDWQNDSVKVLKPEGELFLKGYGGFAPVAISPEGTKFAWCDATGQIFFWDVVADQTRPLRSYPIRHNAQLGNEEGIWGLLFSPDGTKIAAIAKKGVLLQNVYTGWRWFAELKTSVEKLTTFAFNHDGFEMAIGIMILEDAIRRPPKRSKYSRQPVLQQLPPGSADSSGKTWYSVVRIWDLRAADYIDIVVGASPIRDLAFSPDNLVLAAVDEEGVLKLWDIMPEGSVINPPRLAALLELGITGRKTRVIFSPDLKRLICATDNRILIWNIEKVRQEWKALESQKPDE